MTSIILIVYTTQYRKGGAQFRQVAETLAREKRSLGMAVRCVAVERKIALQTLLKQLKGDGQLLAEFHFVGHAGIYGPMWGSTEYPEQFSPYELRQLEFPWAIEAKAYFHACRTARWFAPYFARQQQVTSYGYHWYTTFSAQPDRYRFPGKQKPHRPLYAFGSPGRKSHGWGATFKKVIGKMAAEPWKEFSPSAEPVDTSYNEVAKLYAATFADITVRRDEFAWLRGHLPQDAVLRVLDVGCGNGSLLKALLPQLDSGVGVDVSEGLLLQAKKVAEENPQLSFYRIEGPTLPLPDHSVDVAISLLSFRYLDWDPMLVELMRVLKPNGKLLVVDMVTAPVTLSEYPQLLRSKLRHYQDRKRRPEFYSKLRQLVTHPGWAHMLKFNPIRSLREMQTYLESRFPGRKAEIINVGLHSRILAFDSGPVSNYQPGSTQYP